MIETSSDLLRSSSAIFGNAWKCSENVSLPAEVLFLVFADGKKDTSAMGRKWLSFNRRPQSWTALFKTHAPCIVC